MAGYLNYSMSNNAVAAYERGLMPLSKWTKTAIISAAAEYLESDDNAAEKLSLLQKCKLPLLKTMILRRTEWHHTSCHYNATDFYGIDEFALDELTSEKVQEWRTYEKHKEKKEPAGKKLGSIDFIEWGGTRKHPKAFERTLENVEIEEKGCFYIVTKNGKQILKKKIGSNGTFVRYSN